MDDATDPKDKEMNPEKLDSCSYYCQHFGGNVFAYLGMLCCNNYSCLRNIGHGRTYDLYTGEPVRTPGPIILIDEWELETGVCELVTSKESGKSLEGAAVS